MLANKLKTCVVEGVQRGIPAALRLLYIMVPVSLLVFLLEGAGLVSAISNFIAPAFAVFGLPGEAAIVLVTGIIANNYSAVAIMVAIPMTTRQITILALMALISHNLPVELAVQRSAGSSAARMMVLRLSMSLIAGIALNLILPADSGPATAAAVSAAVDHGFAAWAWGTAALSVKIVVLVIGLMILQRLLEAFGVTRLIARLLAHPLRLLGLPPSTAFLWIVANTLGLAYGAAVLIEKYRSGEISKQDAEILNRHVAICHSLLEDSTLFILIGASAFWVTVPRVVLAAFAVWAYRAWRAFGMLRAAEEKAVPAEPAPAPASGPAGPVQASVLDGL